MVYFHILATSGWLLYLWLRQQFNMSRRWELLEGNTGYWLGDTQGQPPENTL